MMGNASWRGKAFSFFSHKECEAFPCHEGINPEDFNCLFCYCPLYALGDKCKGNFVYTASGVKDCSGCAVPHKKDSYGYVIGRFEEIVEVIRRNKGDTCDVS